MTWKEIIEVRDNKRFSVLMEAENKSTSARSKILVGLNFNWEKFFFRFIKITTDGPKKLNNGFFLEKKINFPLFSKL